MARDRLDGRTVTRCDSGAEIQDSNFSGLPGLTEFLGVGACASCRASGETDPVGILLRSHLLSAEDRQAAQDYLTLAGPEHIRARIALVPCDPTALRRLTDDRQN